MKNKALLSKLACAVACLSPLVITGCDTMGDVFGGSGYRSDQPYQQVTSQKNAAAKAYSASSSSSTSQTVTNKTASTSAVPVEPPASHMPGSSTPTVTSGSAPVKAPAVVKPSSGPTMIPPTVAQ